MGGFRSMFSKLLLAGLLGAALAAPNKPANDDKEYKKMTPEAAASCDPDYGWINGPDDSNKCYMILRDTEIANCGVSSCYDYSCSGGGGYYGYVNWYEAQQCCVNNYG